MYYLDISTILQARNVLISDSRALKKKTVLCTFLIMKAAGFNAYEYQPNSIMKNAFGQAFRLTSLFSPDEPMPDSSSFLYPQSLDTYKNGPTENFKVYISNRVKNNFAGGGTFWHDIVYADRNNCFKFAYDYVDSLFSVQGKVTANLLAMSVWFSRFKAFDQKPTNGNSKMTRVLRFGP